jgi:hypothetical protein
VAARRSPGGVQDWDFIPSILLLCSAQSKWGARLGCLPSPVIFVLPIDHFARTESPWRNDRFVNFGSGLIRAAMRSGIRCRNNQPAVRAWLISGYGLSLWQVRLTADDVTLSMVVARWGEPPALSADLRFGGPWSRSRGGKRLRSKTWCLLKTPRVCVWSRRVSGLESND